MAVLLESFTRIGGARLAVAAVRVILPRSLRRYWDAPAESEVDAGTVAVEVPTPEVP